MKMPKATGFSTKKLFLQKKNHRRNFCHSCNRRRCTVGSVLLLLLYLWGAVGWISFHLAEPSSLSIISSSHSQSASSTKQRFHQNWSQQIWRYDELPMEWEPLSWDVPLLPCVPSEYRLPDNWQDMLSKNESMHDYLFDYNPSIVQLPKTLAQHFHHSARYVASFRVSNQHYCMHPSDRQKLLAKQEPSVSNNETKSSRHRDYLGLALLQDDGRILQSVVVDLTKAGFPAAQDFRLFVLHQQLYISSYDLIAPLYLDNRAQKMSSHSLKTQSMQQIPIVFGDWKAYVGRQPACAGCGRRNACGKNFNYIALPNSPADTALVEVWPSAPHLLQSIHLTRPCRRMQEARQVFATPNDPIRSFVTVESTLFPEIAHSDNRGIFTRGRGSACCLPLVHPHGANRVLRIGIQHSKTPSQKRQKKNPSSLEANHYVSSWYAWDAQPPHALVAQSGYFCLPFATKDHSHAATRATAWRHLKVGNASFVKCPRIHFVSGLTLDSEKNRAVIAYGVNDCYSRLVQIPLSQVTRMLFGK